ncbi:DNA-directed RNA polymerase III subunit RPC3-like [Tachypleus tridentatus]|uniref:DNA-directed RNA polymerase III subunit RPC3-like n=1 Tax=Tachypleus tridentatus TaxID=6853 RepID=UPI003FD0241E
MSRSFRFERYGYTGELIVEELLTNGQMTMSTVVGKVTSRLSEATESGVSPNQVKDIFVKLVQTHFVQRCPVPQSSDGVKPVAPTMNISENEMYLIPEIKLHLLRKSEGTDEPPAKRRRVETEDEKQPDEDIYWRVNFVRFHHYFRDQALIDAASRRLGPRAADILRTILRLAETRSDPWTPTTCCVSQQEILQAVVKETNIVKLEIAPYLSVLTEDSANLLSKVEDRGGGVYTVTTYKALQKLVEAIIMSVVEDRFGSNVAEYLGCY